MTIDLDDPIALLLAASSAFAGAGIEAAAYGGLALGMYGEVRETRDAGLAVSSVDALVAQAALASLGVTAAIAFTGVRFGGCELTRLSLVGGGVLNTVDLVQPRSPRYRGAVLSRALEGTLRGQSLRVVSPEDFVILKVLATRDRDLEDARSVVDKLGDRLDLALVDDEAAKLAVELPDHPVAARLAAIRARG